MDLEGTAILINMLVRRSWVPSWVFRVKGKVDSSLKVYPLEVLEI